MQSFLQTTARTLFSALRGARDNVFKNDWVAMVAGRWTNMFRHRYVHTPCSRTLSTEELIATVTGRPVRSYVESEVLQYDSRDYNLSFFKAE